MMYYIVLYCIILYYIVLYYYIILCYIILYYLILYCIILYYIVLYCIIYVLYMYYIVLYYITLYYIILYSIYPGVDNSSPKNREINSMVSIFHPKIRSRLRCCTSVSSCRSICLPKWFVAYTAVAESLGFPALARWVKNHGDPTLDT